MTVTLDPDNTDVPDEPVEHGGAPGWVVWLLIVLASVIAVGATLNAWADRQLLDTDNWVDLSDELLADDDVRLALSRYLVDQVYDNVDVAADLEQRLPDNLQALAGPIAAGLRQPATEIVDRLLETAPVRAAWTAVNRAAHERVVNVLEDDTVVGTSTADGTVTVDLGELVTAVGQKIGLPEALVDRIPDDAGQIVLIQSDELSAAQNAVQAVQFMSVFLFILVVVLYAAAVFFAYGRRRETVRNVGWALAVSGLLVLVIRRITVQFAVDQVEGGGDIIPAVRSIASIATNALSGLAWLGVAIGVLMALFAMLVGPSAAAVAIRRVCAPVLGNALAIWALAVVVAVIYVAVRPSVGFANWLPRLVFVALVITAVELLRRQVHREHPDASFGDSWGNLRSGVSDLWHRA